MGEAEHILCSAGISEGSSFAPAELRRIAFALAALRRLTGVSQPKLRRSEGWLGRQDSNLGSRYQKPLPYRLATPQAARTLELCVQTRNPGATGVGCSVFFTGL